MPMTAKQKNGKRQNKTEKDVLIMMQEFEACEVTFQAEDADLSMSVPFLKMYSRSTPVLTLNILK